MRNTTKRTFGGLLAGSVPGLLISASAWGSVWFWPMVGTFAACGAGVAFWSRRGTEASSTRWRMARAGLWRGPVIAVPVWTTVICISFGRTMSMEEAGTALVSSWFLMAALAAAVGAVVGFCASPGGRR